MKWFFALNEDSSSFLDYARMILVAVHTAQKHTSLEPYFLYDGDENDLTETLRQRGVTVVKRRAFLYDRLKQIADLRNYEDVLRIGAGAFLRTEIPQLTEEMQIADEYVLYTDVDIMFMDDVGDQLTRLRPKYFAVAPEHDKTNYKKMNSGVMLMNLKNLRSRDAEFRDFMVRNMERLVDYGWDQGAYRLFYKGKFFGFHWNKLPPEFNQKPYWGAYDHAKIIHFHGPKPFQKEVMTSPNPPDYAKPLLPLVTDQYIELCELWEKHYLEAKQHISGESDHHNGI